MLMGLWFSIVFKNMQATGEKRFDFYSVKPAHEAWQEAVEFAYNEWLKLFAEDKYWYLKEIQDATLR